MYLVKNGACPYRIVISGQATTAQKYAADQLRDYLTQMTGAPIGVMPDNIPGLDKEICVGPTNREDAPSLDRVEHDGFQIKAVGQRLFISGKLERGTLYGVYGLLEDVLGCRFYAMGCEKIPQRNDIEIPDDFDLVENAPFYYGRITSWLSAHNISADFRAKRRQNMSLADERHGASVYQFHTCHTFVRRYVSPTKYGDHPEYYALTPDGKRLDDPEWGQLCLSNPDVLAITIEELKQDMRDHPECISFNLSQNDTCEYCHCPRCAAIDAEEGSTCGTVLRFVNACADAIRDEFPDKMIEMLAYQWTRQLPKLTKPRDNVEVRLCTIECCFSHPLDECETTTASFASKYATQSFQKDMEDWAKVSKMLGIWDYTTNFANYMTPFPNIPVLQRNIKYFLRNKTVAIYEQGNSQGISGEFGELRSYLLSRLMWNPDIDVEADTWDFMTGFYGQAARPLKAYLDLVNKTVAETGEHHCIYHAPSEKRFPPAMIAEAKKLFAEAEQLADNAVIASRVRRLRLGLRYMEICQKHLGDPTRQPMLDAFAEDVRSYGIREIREWELLEKSFERLSQNENNQ